MTYAVINNKFQREPDKEPDWKPFILLIIAMALVMAAGVFGFIKLTLFR